MSGTLRANEHPRWRNHCLHGFGHTDGHTCDGCCRAWPLAPVKEDNRG